MAEKFSFFAKNENAKKNGNHNRFDQTVVHTKILKDFYSSDHFSGCQTREFRSPFEMGRSYSR